MRFGRVRRPALEFRRRTACSVERKPGAVDPRCRACRELREAGRTHPERLSASVACAGVSRRDRIARRGFFIAPETGQHEDTDQRHHQRDGAAADEHHLVLGETRGKRGGYGREAAAFLLRDRLCHRPCGHERGLVGVSATDRRERLPARKAFFGIEPKNELGHRLRTIGGIGLQRHFECRPEPGGYVGQVRHAHALTNRVGGRSAHVRMLAGSNRAKGQRKAVEIRPGADIAPVLAELFGSDIAKLARKTVAHDGPGVFAGVLGDAEIDDLGARGIVLRQQDVVRSNIAVDRAQGVRRPEARSQFARDRRELLVGQLDFAQLVFEAGSVDEFRDNVRTALGIARRQAVLHDRLVMETGQRFRFLGEHRCHQFVLRKVLEHHLDRHLFGWRVDVHCLVDFTHPAAGEETGDPIDAVEHLAFGYLAVRFRLARRCRCRGRLRLNWRRRFRSFIVFWSIGASLAGLGGLIDGAILIVGFVCHCIAPPISITTAVTLSGAPRS